MFPLIKFDPNMHTFQSHAALCNFNLFTCRYYVPQLYSRAHQQWSVARSLEASVHHVDQKRTIVGFPNSVSAVFDVAAALLSLYIYMQGVMLVAKVCHMDSKNISVNCKRNTSQRVDKGWAPDTLKFLNEGSLNKCWRYGFTSCVKHQHTIPTVSIQDVPKGIVVETCVRIKTIPKLEDQRCVLLDDSIGCFATMFQHPSSQCILGRKVIVQSLI